MKIDSTKIDIGRCPVCNTNHDLQIEVHDSSYTVCCNNCCTTENKTMTLDEAIEHCLKNVNDTSCGREHKQLAEWLKELKMYRENLLKGN